MADKDLSEKVLIELPDVFADIYNSLVFKGDKGTKTGEFKTDCNREYI